MPAAAEPARKTAAGRVDLRRKTQPAQDRSRATYDAILAAAGALLAEVGIERFSTNLVCRRAGLTPPALYRYFPNKYALLKELGERLMQAQDAEVFAWIEQGGLADGDLARGIEDVFGRVVAVTAAFPGSLWILRAMRAVPLLRDVRLASTGLVADRMQVILCAHYPATDPARLHRAAWLTTETANAVLEMILDGQRNDGAALLREACAMIARYYEGFR